MKRRIRTILTIFLISSILLVGCKFFKAGIPTVVTLTQSAIRNVEKAESAEIWLKTDGDFTLTETNLNIGMDLTMHSDVDMEMTRNPGRGKGTVDFTIGAVGQEQTVNGEFYRDTADNGVSTTYIRWKNGDWMKKTGKESETQEQGTDNSSSGSEGIKLPASAVRVIGILKAISDGSITAELCEETVTINDKEAWQINCSLSGDFLKQALGTSGVSLGGVSLDQLDIDWESLSVPAELYIYKELELPAGARIDCTPIGAKIFEKLFEGYLDQLPVGNVRLDVSSFTLDITIDRYDEIEAIEIPAETAGAVETESLLPTMTDLIKFW